MSLRPVPSASHSPACKGPPHRYLARTPSLDRHAIERIALQGLATPADEPKTVLDDAVAVQKDLGIIESIIRLSYARFSLVTAVRHTFGRDATSYPRVPGQCPPLPPGAVRPFASSMSGRPHSADPRPLKVILTSYVVPPPLVVLIKRMGTVLQLSHSNRNGYRQT